MSLTIPPVLGVIRGTWLKLAVLIGLDIDVGGFVVIVLEYHHQMLHYKV